MKDGSGFFPGLLVGVAVTTVVCGLILIDAVSADAFIGGEALCRDNGGVKSVQQLSAWAPEFSVECKNGAVFENVALKKSPP